MNLLVKELVLPERSRLYYLQPIAIGTPLCESLTSYLQRLSASHSMSVTSFIKELLSPSIEKDYINKDVIRGCSRFLQRACVINGMEILSQDCLGALESLTLITNLSCLTMQRWSEVLISKNICRSYKAWCTCCLNEWKKNNFPIYEPLLWSLTEVQACPIHKTPLRENCPNLKCKKLIPILSSFSLVGYCSHCGQWLGESTDNNGQVLLNREIWISDTIGTVIGHISNQNNILRDNVKQSFQLLINQLTNGNIEAASKLLNIPKTTFYHYCKSKFLPLNRNLLDICYIGGISLIDFLLAKPFTFITNNDGYTTYTTRTNPGRNPINWKFIKNNLINCTKEVPPPSLNIVTDRQQVSIKTLKKKFPELTATIKNNHAIYIHARAKNRVGNICDEVTNATKNLYRQGKIPTARAVEIKIGKRGALKRKEIYLAWRNAKKQFLWEHQKT